MPGSRRGCGYRSPKWPAAKATPKRTDPGLLPRGFARRRVPELEEGLKSRSHLPSRDALYGLWILRDPVVARGGGAGADPLGEFCGIGSKDARDRKSTRLNFSL